MVYRKQLNKLSHISVLGKRVEKEELNTSSACLTFFFLSRAHLPRRIGVLLAGGSATDLGNSIGNGGAGDGGGWPGGEFLHHEDGVAVERLHKGSEHPQRLPRLKKDEAETRP